MKRITATFQTEDTVNKVIEALKDAEMATESIGNLMRSKTEVIDDEDQYMLVVNVDGNREEIVKTILNSAGGKGIQSVESDWQPSTEWIPAHGVDPHA